MQELTFAILGYGGRGRGFAHMLKEPAFAGRVVAVAEPDPDKRADAARLWDLPPDRLFDSAAGLLAQPRLADVMINTTMDRLHAATAIPAMRLGYHLLLEKPMAVTLADCEAIERTQRATGVVVCVAHSLRYHRLYATVKAMIDAGQIGEVMSFDQLEGVGDVHFSHSFCRGNWGNQSRSTFMLMSKSCHDIDLFSHLVGRPCRRVSSFGSLRHFTRANAPHGAPERCLDGCPAAEACPYHAAKVYLDIRDWRYVFPRQDDASVREYLRAGPYGRCVYQTDNDVVDHQVVALEYEGGLTGTFTMTAFHPGGRYLRVHGTKGFLQADVDRLDIWHTDFITRNTSQIKVAIGAGGHGGGDSLVMRSLVDAVRQGDPQAVLTTAQESLASHRIVFAAEQSRLEGRVVEL
jgi:predicted dehydrogenase